MNSKLKKKLAKLPTTPGVYFHKDAGGEIIYIGKAANLRNRVRQYFHPSTSLRARKSDLKTEALISEIADTDWTEVETEVDALFLEAELVKRYLPRFNILLRDDKSQLFVRISYKSDYPTVTTVRRPLDDGAEYFGPYFNGYAIKKALRYLRRAFPYAVSRPVNQKRVSLHYHLGLDPGLEEGRTNLADYRANLRMLMQYLRGQRVAIVKEIEREMKRAAKVKDFEAAVKFRNQLYALRELSRQSLFGDREALDASRDQALVDLAALLNLEKPPRRIEGFDISHMQGTDTAASMVVFVNGMPDKASYRKFKMRIAGNDDFAHMHEALTRRLREENRKKWGIPDLILIDGGKGQLQAALRARDSAHSTGSTSSQKASSGQAGLQIPMIGLAKRFEEIILKNPTIPQNSHFQGGSLESGELITIILPQSSHIIKLLQRIRDESHRFAVSYHSTLKQKRQTASLLDEIPGIGPATRKKLIKHFGSTRGVINAETSDLQAVLGAKKANTISKSLAAYR